MDISLKVPYQNQYLTLFFSNIPPWLARAIIILALVGICTKTTLFYL